MKHIPNSSVTGDPYLLRSDIPTLTTPVCPDGYGADCRYPACGGCVGDQIAKHWAPEQRADHLKAIGKPMDRGSIAPTVAYVLCAAIATVLFASICNALFSIFAA